MTQQTDSHGGRETRGALNIDGKAVSGLSPIERERPSMMDVELEDCSTKRLYKETKLLLSKKMCHSGNSGAEHELCEVESSGFLPAYPVCVPQDRWGIKGGEDEREQDIQNKLLRSCCTAEGSIDLVIILSTYRSPGCCDLDPVSAAAHLHLLGESLSLIGHHLQETNKVVSLSSSSSLLLDSLLCALAPLISLTEVIPELRSCTQHTLASTLENIAYVMPGL
ncbi:uncharacterized protein LOC127354160 isoform X5 [Dicentrarchus labrax]|uniref:uncharacterized protein LOC127354160 isoform X5 n=1 Tax=Dicentrarchus labrax TaxID=13489 RepID=UPI0021F5EAA3|nr:uncharacterized protein LOC127354160 isoform X5 [Dicentrarchus labrax]